MYHEELHELYCWPNIIWPSKSNKTRWAGHVAYVESNEIRTELWWRNQKSITVWKTRHSWVDNMKIVVKEVDLEEMEWIHLAENRDR